MGTLSGLGSERVGGGGGGLWWEQSCSINGLNLTVFSEFPAAAGSCFRLINPEIHTVHSNKQQAGDASNLRGGGPK